MELLINKTNETNECVHRPAEMLSGEPVGQARRWIKALYVHWLGIASALLKGRFHRLDQLVVSMLK